MSEFITTIKIRNNVYVITGQDRFMDNGACVQLITQRGPWAGWSHAAIVLTKKAIKHISAFERIEMPNSGSGRKDVKIFAIKQHFEPGQEPTTNIQGKS